MKKIITLNISVILALFILSACATVPAADSETPESSKHGSEQTKTEEVNAADIQPPQWVADDGESASSSAEKCVVGKISSTSDLGITVMQAFDRARIKFCKSSVSIDVDTATNTTVKRMNSCVIPPTEEREVWKSGDGTVYVLVCADRDKIDDESEDEQEETEETDDNNELDNQ